METRPLVVPDVNVLVSGATVSQYAPSLVVQAWKDELINFATSEPILNDLQRVFTYPKVLKLTGMKPKAVHEYVQTIREGSNVVLDIIDVRVSPDPDDDKLFACAVEASADYIVSMDVHHVLSVGEYQDVKTIHPSDFVRTILTQEQAA
jgi:putative PIN family toxin of toxin-antitoxin system